MDFPVPLGNDSLLTRVPALLCMVSFGPRTLATAPKGVWQLYNKYTNSFFLRLIAALKLGGRVGSAYAPLITRRTVRSSGPGTSGITGCLDLLLDIRTLQLYEKYMQKMPESATKYR